MEPAQAAPPTTVDSGSAMVCVEDDPSFVALLEAHSLAEAEARAAGEKVAGLKEKVAKAPNPIIKKVFTKDLLEAKAAAEQAVKKLSDDLMALEARRAELLR